MSHARYIVGDALTVLRTLPAGSVDLVMSSPAFLALRSYLPADHPQKHLEMGSEATPGEFLDVLLDVVEECARVLAPHGSLVFELGDTYAGSGGAGGDYGEGGLRDGAPGFDGSAKQRRGSTPSPLGQGQPPSVVVHPGRREPYQYPRDRGWQGSEPKEEDGIRIRNPGGKGWPLDKSKVLVPQLFAIALAYGFNPLTGRTTPPWRVRNTVAWCLDGDTVVYARTPKGEGPTRLLHLSQNFQPGQWELWDGQRWMPVLGWSTREATDAIEIEFRNGERVSATREHEWPTQRGLVRTEALTAGDVIQSVLLPEPHRAEPEHLPSEDIGWLVGAFLADGSFDSRDRIQIAGHAAEGPLRLARLQKLARAFDGSATSHDYGNEGTVVVRSPVLVAVLRRYLGGTSARNKCLRAAAWRRGNKFLSALLDGYLDGDGHYEAKNGRWRLGFTDNPWLARDLRVLCARLGISCRIKRVPRAADPRGGKFANTARFMHHGSIRFDLTRRARPDSEIVALRPSKRRRFFDIGVEGEPHLFALGSGILTHNCRPNPPVGRDGDKFRPATSFLTVACKARDRYWDGDAVRTTPQGQPDYPSNGPKSKEREALGVDGTGRYAGRVDSNPAGAPLLDWWEIPTAPYKGSHYATYPPDLVVPVVKAMCPAKVCRVCGKPSTRITERTEDYARARAEIGDFNQRGRDGKGVSGSRSVLTAAVGRDITCAENVTVGWSDCFCHNANVDDGPLDKWRPGVVLDPFAGSGTTLAVATGHGRDAIGIDLDERNADLALERCGMFLTVERFCAEAVA